MKRVAVITGVGCIASLGITMADFCREIDHKLSETDATYSGGRFFEPQKVKNFQFHDVELLQKYPRLDFSCQYLLQAVKQAFENGNITSEVIKRYRVGIIIGSTFGLLASQEKFLKLFYKNGKGSPSYFQQTANNLLSGIIACKYRIDGLNMTLYNGWTAGLDAIILAEKMISMNELDLVIAGGVDILTESIITQYHYYRNKKSFHDYFFPGEGAGIVLLEAADIAAQRKQVNIGRVTGGQQISFWNRIDFMHKLQKIISDLKFDFYLANINGTMLDDPENLVLKSNKVNPIKLKKVIGECGAVSGIFQAIYSLGLTGRSVNVNAALGQLSYVTIEQR
jgi:3-oxoacyl-(acyl-carrier-protein) synthase